MWRAEDQALLERLEDETALELFWQVEAPSAPSLHPRAAGLMQLVRRIPEGPAALDALRAGNVDPLVRLVRPASMSGLPGALLHHLAVYNHRLAFAGRLAQAQLDSARLWSLAAWIALEEEAVYLRRLAHAVLGDNQDADDAVRAAVLAPLDELGREACAGARDLDAASSSALRIMAKIGEACRIAGCAAITQTRFERHAERLRGRAIEAALLPISEAVSEATARGKAEAEGALLMDRVAAVWAWSDSDEHVERFAIDVVTPIAWNVYHEKNSDGAMRRLIDPIQPLVDRLAWRIEVDPSRIAYAGPCAQMYVFRSEMLSNAEDRLRWAERSLEICPTHRNGRLTLASLLANDVRDRLHRSAMFMQGSEFHELETKLARAEELYPRTRGLDDLKAKVAEARSRSWWSR